eukprot:tig00001086_g6855.t1
MGSRASSTRYAGQKDVKPSGSNSSTLRALGELERFWHACSGIGYGNVVVCVKLEGPLVPELFRAAWLACLREQTALRVAVTEEAGIKYFRSLSEWSVRRTFEVVQCANEEAREEARQAAGARRFGNEEALARASLLVADNSGAPRTAPSSSSRSAPPSAQRGALVAALLGRYRVLQRPPSTLLPKPLPPRPRPSPAPRPRARPRRPPAPLRGAAPPGVEAEPRAARRGRGGSASSAQSWARGHGGAADGLPAPGASLGAALAAAFTAAAAGAGLVAPGPPRAPRGAAVRPRPARRAGPAAPLGGRAGRPGRGDAACYAAVLSAGVPLGPATPLWELAAAAHEAIHGVVRRHEHLACLRAPAPPRSSASVAAHVGAGAGTRWRGAGAGRGAAALPAAPRRRRPRHARPLPLGAVRPAPAPPPPPAPSRGPTRGRAAAGLEPAGCPLRVRSFAQFVGLAGLGPRAHLAAALHRDRSPPPPRPAALRRLRAGRLCLWLSCAEEAGPAGRRGPPRGRRRVPARRRRGEPRVAEALPPPAAAALEAAFEEAAQSLARRQPSCPPRPAATPSSTPLPPRPAPPPAADTGPAPGGAVVLPAGARKPSAGERKPSAGARKSSAGARRGSAGARKASGGPGRRPTYEPLWGGGGDREEGARTPKRAWGRDEPPGVLFVGPPTPLAYT